DTRSAPAAVDMWMSVLFARAAVRRPAGVADPGVSRGGVRRDDRREVIELALRPHDLERPVLLHCDAGRVIAAVLEAPQSAHEQRQRLAGPHVTDYPAHLDELPFSDASEHVRRARGKSRVTSLDGDAQDRLGSGRPHEQTSGRTERDLGLFLGGSERVVLLPFAPPRGLHVVLDLW